MSHFYGRETELQWLQSQWAACTTRKGAKCAGPRMALVLADTGLGKTRLVQELYRTLAASETWNPHQYWPHEIGGTDANMDVQPLLEGHAAGGLPGFLWLGERFSDPLEQNIQRRSSVLPELSATLIRHCTKIRSSLPAWEAAAREAQSSIKRRPGVVTQELLGQLAGASLPGGDLLLKLIAWSSRFARERARGPLSHDVVRSDVNRRNIDDAIESMSEWLSGRTAIPMVLWLDDAQWIDDESLNFLTALWEKASAGNWPLFVVITHWLHPWRDKEALARNGCTSPSLYSAFAGCSGVSRLELERAADELLRARLKWELPGIDEAQARLLIEKADGNFLTMVENIRELHGEESNFVGEDCSRALTPEAVLRISAFESQRDQRVKQRFRALDKPIKNLLSWSTEFGPRFIGEVVAEFASERAPDTDPRDSLERCVNPLVILTSPGLLHREFRDLAMYRVAKVVNNLTQEDRDNLQRILRKHITIWVNGSFDESGTPLRHDDFSQACSVPHAAVALPTHERHEFLRKATDELFFSDPRSAPVSEMVVAFRACLLRAIDDENGRFEKHEACAKIDQLPVETIPESVLNAGVIFQLLDEAHRVHCTPLVRRLRLCALQTRIGRKFALRDSPRLTAERIKSLEPQPDELRDLRQLLIRLGDDCMDSAAHAEALELYQTAIVVSEFMRDQSAPSDDRLSAIWLLCIARARAAHSLTKLRRSEDASVAYLACMRELLLVHSHIPIASAKLALSGIVAGAGAACLAADGSAPNSHRSLDIIDVLARDLEATWQVGNADDWDADGAFESVLRRFSGGSIHQALAYAARKYIQSTRVLLSIADPAGLSWAGAIVSRHEITSIAQSLNDSVQGLTRLAPHCDYACDDNASMQIIAVYRQWSHAVCREGRCGAPEDLGAQNATLSAKECEDCANTGFVPRGETGFALTMVQRLSWGLDYCLLKQAVLRAKYLWRDNEIPYRELDPNAIAHMGLIGIRPITWAADDAMHQVTCDLYALHRKPVAAHWPDEDAIFDWLSAHNYNGMPNSDCTRGDPGDLAQRQDCEHGWALLRAMAAAIAEYPNSRDDGGPLQSICSAIEDSLRMFAHRKINGWPKQCDEVHTLQHRICMRALHLLEDLYVSTLSDAGGEGGLLELRAAFGGVSTPM